MRCISEDISQASPDRYNTAYRVYDRSDREHAQLSRGIGAFCVLSDAHHDAPSIGDAKLLVGGARTEGTALSRQSRAC